MVPTPLKPLSLLHILTLFYDTIHSGWQLLNYKKSQINSDNIKILPNIKSTVWSFNVLKPWFLLFFLPSEISTERHFTIIGCALLKQLYSLGQYMQCYHNYRQSLIIISDYMKFISYMPPPTKKRKKLTPEENGIMKGLPRSKVVEQRPIKWG